MGMKKLLIACGLLGWMLVSTASAVSIASAHDVLSKEPCPSKMFPAEPCAFHLVKKGETGARILARYNSPEVAVYFEDLSEVPVNLYILERERPSRFKDAWDYLRPEDVIVFPFLSKETVWEAWRKKIANHLSWQETTLGVLGEKLRGLEEKQDNLEVMGIIFIVFLVAAILVLGWAVIEAILAIKARREIIADRISDSDVDVSGKNKAQNRSGA